MAEIIRCIFILLQYIILIPLTIIGVWKMLDWITGLFKKTESETVSDPLIIRTIDRSEVVHVNNYPANDSYELAMREDYKNYVKIFGVEDEEKGHGRDADFFRNKNNNYVEKMTPIWKSQGEKFYSMIVNEINRSVEEDGLISFYTLYRYGAMFGVFNSLNSVALNRFEELVEENGFRIQYGHGKHFAFIIDWYERED